LVVAAVVVGGRLLLTGQGKSPTTGDGPGGATAVGVVGNGPATSGGPGGTPAATGTPATGGTPATTGGSAPATAAPSGGTVTAADLVGTWAGPVQHWSTTGARLTLTGTGRTGSVTWDGINCPSDVTLSSSAGSTFTYHLAVRPVHDDICTTAGWLKATVSGGTMSIYWWEDGNSGNTLTGTLTRRG
jgi:hypothetical protein